MFAAQPTTHSHKLEILPSFIKPLPSAVPREDLLYLNHKGAFSVPQGSLLTALLQAFLDHVYPDMPIVDLHIFVTTIVQSRVSERQEASSSDSTEKISLVLFQAVMFSAIAFVDVKFVREAGFASRKDARRLYFQKTRLLYDLDYESDCTILIQVLLLMTLWYETPDDEKDASHWLSVAISLAQAMGMDRLPTDLQVPKQRLWKRIWWTCFMRSQSIVLGLRCAPHFDSKKFRTPMLQEEDFDIRDAPATITSLPSGYAFMQDTNIQRNIASIIISKARLCLCISRILETQYAMQRRTANGPDGTTGNIMMLLPHENLNMGVIDQMDKHLQAWEESLPACCRYTRASQRDVQEKKTIFVQRAVLHMLHQTAIITLHRPIARRADGGIDVWNRKHADESCLKTTQAAALISEMASGLRHMGIEGYLPDTGVTVLLASAMAHVIDMRHPPTSLPYQRAAYRVSQCRITLEYLRDTYNSADMAISLLDAALDG
jgi:hypothetical protein